MSFGLTFVNNKDVVTLDSEFSRLVIVESGTWTTNSSQNTPIFFKTAVTTIEPPLVFVRSNTACNLYYCQVIGTPGNWTAVSFSTSLVGATGKWFSAVFRSTPTATYGLRLWDANNTLIFDNGTPCAQFTGTVNNWTYLGATQTSQGLTNLMWTPTGGFPLSNGDYILINNIAFDMPGLVSRQGNMYAYWDFPNNRMLLQAVGVDLPSAQYLPMVFAKPFS
ncbi:hypothetical protein [Pseudomonas sp. LBUM920]|uniref:hypothetical protein n=1 Tax=Pseudomonas sp. LBUM920 TaxID=2126069 RepID=UPI000F55EAFE|nr:hypothetical protein [Pseudomonas sp. LBUM920]AZF63797.1 hypothetical protein C4J83_2808 [Pseudomonas sp. LBUM920]